MSINSLGSRTIQGQRCVGYRIILTEDETRQTGEFWVNAGCKLPARFNLKASEKPLVTMRMVWSHWNDPALRLPAVKS